MLNNEQTKKRYKRPETKNSLLVSWHILLILWRTSLVKYCGVLIRFHEAMKLKSFEYDLSEVISANAQNISAVVLFAYFC